MVRIQIESAKMLERSGTSQRTGRAYQIREQNALLFREGESYPDKVKVPVHEGQSAYAPGWYTLSDASYVTSRFGQIELRPTLVPLRTAESKGAAA